jgi:hypothetical protein
MWSVFGSNYFREQLFTFIKNVSQELESTDEHFEGFQVLTAAIMKIRTF